mmetsp:Transcript_24577/g.39884  ORF Transcript_24577/g.39884 Transcript_24577/m.39884 type:complete len:105 (-) Transcript_24577:1537-1851(-)
MSFRIRIKQEEEPEMLSDDILSIVATDSETEDNICIKNCPTLQKIRNFQLAATCGTTQESRERQRSFEQRVDVLWLCISTFRVCSIFTESNHRLIVNVLCTKTG